MRPVADPFHQAMLHGIVVNVVYVSGEVLVVTDRVLPISPLPECEFAVRVPLDVRADFKQTGAEITFDASPPGRKVRIVYGQSEDGVQVIRQDHDCIDRKWPLLPGHAKRSAKYCDAIDKSLRPPISKRQGEEKRSACKTIAPISDHFGIIPVFCSDQLAALLC